MFRNREIRRFSLVLALIAVICAIGCFRASFSAGAWCLSGFLLGYAAVFIMTHKRYREIAKLGERLADIASGHCRFALDDVKEGELSILQSEIYKFADRLTEQAELLSKEKDAMASAISDISHQLKTPLTSLVMMAELLEDERLPAQKRAEFSQNLEMGLHRMEWLILSLLKIAKLDSGTMQMDYGEHRIRELAASAQKSLALLMESKSQLLWLEGDESIAVVCDFNWMVEALSNILKNAAEHSPEGSKITLSWGKNPICTWISVTDCGGGIAKKDMPHLFKRFYKGENAAKDSVGIGLALALSIMQKQRGDIEILNHEGQGAEFVLKIFA